jgi:hypothetical protein
VVNLLVHNLLYDLCRLRIPVPVKLVDEPVKEVSGGKRR